MKKLKYFILAGIITLSGTVFAAQISVPSSPGAGYMLQGLSTGNWQASSTATGYFGNYVATSTRTSVFPYASSTAISTLYASSTLYFGANLATCNSTTGKITWSAGVFGCGTDFNTGVFPFTVNANYNSTSTAIGFLNGLFSTASSTFSSSLFLPALSQGSLYLGSSGLVKTIGTSTVSFSSPLSGASFDVLGTGAGAITCPTCVVFHDEFTHPASGESATTSLMHLDGGFISSASSTVAALFRVVGMGIGKAPSTSIRNEIITDSTYTQGQRIEGDITTRLGNSSYVTGDAQVRFTQRIDGLLGWGGGSAVTDTNLYRSSAQHLTTDNYFTVSTSTSLYVFTVASSTAPQLSLSAGGGLSQWTFRNAGGNLYVSTTTTDGTATSTNSAFALDKNGQPYFGFLNNCANGIKSDTSGALSCGTSGSTAWDSIGDPSGNGSVGMAETTQTLDWDTAAVSALSDDYLTLTTTNDAAADVSTQRLFTLANLAASTNPVEVLERIRNDDSAAVGTGLLIDGAGAFTTAIDASDSDIVTALSTGANDLTGTNWSLTGGSGLFSSSYSSSTIYSSFITSSSTFDKTGTLTLATTTLGCLETGAGGVVFSKGVACGSAAGLSSYDAFTHSNQYPFNSATTSIISIGTTTPYYSLTVASTTGPQIALSDGTAGIASWVFRNSGGNFYLGTTTVAGTATSSISALEIDGTTGTTTVRNFKIANATATTTSNVGFSITSGCYAIGTTCMPVFSNTIANGGTGSTSFAPNSIITSNANGTALIATTSQLTVGTLLATSTLGSATSTFIGALRLGVGSADRDNLLQIDCASRTWPASVSIGGCVNINGLLEVSTSSALTNNRLVVFNDTSSGSTQDTFVASTSGANVSVANFKGAPTGKGVVKIEHTGNLGDSNANSSGLSIDLGDCGLCQGFFVDSTIASTTGNLANFRNKGTQYFTINSFGMTGIGSSTPDAMLSVRGISIATTTFSLRPVGSQTASLFDFYSTSGGTPVGGIAANGLFSSQYSSSTIFSSFITASSTFLKFGTATAATTTLGCLEVGNGGLLFSKGTPCGTSSGLTSYDAWTHINSQYPFNSATTSNIAIGTTTPYYSFTIASSTGPQFALSDGTAGVASWYFRSVGGNFYLGTTTVQGTSTSTPVISIKSCLFAFGCIGLGTTTPVTGLTVVGGAILNAELKPATSTTMTISLASSTAQVIQLGTSATTVTLIDLYAGQATRITVCNPAAGTTGAITWASTPSNKILWTGGTVPSQTTTVNKCDIWTFTTTQATSTDGTVRVFGSQVPNF